MIKQEIVKFIDSFEGENWHRYNHVIGSFFGEVIWPDFDPDDTLCYEQVVDVIGEEVHESLYPFALEFFLSNEYVDPDTQEAWNALDAFLEAKKEEKTFVTGLRDSYASMYEVVDVDSGKSLILRDLVEKKSKPFVVQDSGEVYKLSKKDIIGTRVIDLQNRKELTGGVLRFGKRKSKQTIEQIRFIDDSMLQLIDTFGNDREHSRLMMKKMWIKVIVEDWLDTDEIRKNILAPVTGLRGA